VAIELFSSYRPNHRKLLGAAKRQIFAANDHEAEDCLQDFAKEPYKKIVERYDPKKGNFDGWFSQSFRHHLISWGEKLVRIQQHQILSPMDQESISDDKPADPVTLLLARRALEAYSEHERQDTAETLAALINKMSGDDYEVFFRLAKGMSRHEIASDLHLLEGTVTKRIQRVRKTKEWQDLGRTLYRTAKIYS